MKQRVSNLKIKRALRNRTITSPYLRQFEETLEDNVVDLALEDDLGHNMCDREMVVESTITV